MLLKKRISVVYFLNLIKWDIMAIVIYSVLVGMLDHNSFFRDMVIPVSISALIGTLLSLLLAFRTGQSYERWWEARVVWGAIVNDSRTLIRQLIQFIPAGEEKAAHIERFAIRQATWCYALAEGLRRVSPSAITDNYINELGTDSENRPNLLLTRHAEDLAALSAQYKLDANKQVQLDNTIVKLTDAMGKCERIKNTIFPRSYSVMIHFMIYVLMTILPFGLDDNHFLIEIAVSIMIPSLFIAIERTAILMQDPFENKPTDTPMSTLSATIERNLMEMANLPIPHKPTEPDTFYIM
ncbi:bestrophin family protein [Mucilaginibacter antarcticus]|uniref:Bestrophin family protein n=1 Tax=Mucilaginibacter antarcticus TaxID=1855725 RepID=A0ABW5XJ80_9SPHI